MNKAFILNTSKDGRTATVEGMQGEIYTEVLLINPEGTATNPEPDESSEIQLFFQNGSAVNAVGIPYNVPNQPILEIGEKSFGNFKKGNQISFKKDASILIESGTTKINIAQNGNILISAPLADFSNAINVATAYKVAGIKVLDQQQPAIPNPMMGLSELHATVDLILAMLRTHGLIAT